MCAGILESTRDIAQGEQIFTNYGQKFWKGAERQLPLYQNPTTRKKLDEANEDSFNGNPRSGSKLCDLCGLGPFQQFSNMVRHRGTAKCKRLQQEREARAEHEGGQREQEPEGEEEGQQQQQRGLQPPPP